ncbi:proline--tRNA ligase [Rhizobium sp. R339]|uniref:aminoacyl--tRNA ligase-related protein n=1 Tax=Rhizobium sp. R339 TaxID=1764273 RepID=UPI000B534047|nr:aminoacyl--tRNA ligase-related protein [Rhizobium sp. R339]OWV64029.1 proline--tRNA ligase [Rhizobium sp. R339]
MKKYALSVSRSENFSAWYQAIVREADLAELSPVRGCMVIKPWGYGIWELLQRQLDDRIKAFGFENCYFPLFIPMSFFEKEAQHVEGFAKEMAVVTHHRLANIGGKLQIDPEAVLEDPLIVRPTSETIIGDSFQRWIKSYRDLPVRINQWANVVRWEMRTRMFLRTTEFLWQEGHSAHETGPEAYESTKLALGLYKNFVEAVLAIPTLAGEKPEHERFPGAVSTLSVEAMMQDGKALQAGTSHYLGTHFSRAQNVQFQGRTGEQHYCHTSSWGASTRLIGGLIMTHGDDDGLRCPPAVAPHQVVLVPMLRGKAQDEDILEYCNLIAGRLRMANYFGSPVRVKVDTGLENSAEKRWTWIRRGAPVICEIGSRDNSAKTVSFIRRDRLRTNDRIIINSADIEDFVSGAESILRDIQDNLLQEAADRLYSMTRSDIKDYTGLSQYYGQGGDDEQFHQVKGWARCSWSKPTGVRLTAVENQLKALRLTIRNAPLDQPEVFEPCVFTGLPGVEEIIIGRAY